MKPYFDPERYPTLSEDGARMLKFLREHPQAPIYRNSSGNKLTSDDLNLLADYERKLNNSRVDWNERHLPQWLNTFVDNVYRDVPFYRSQGKPPQFTDIPPVTRADFSRDITAFVPDSVQLDRMINFQTTGTSGNPLLLPSHPRIAATYLCFHRRALRRFGIELSHGPENIGVVLVGHQRRCFTYISVTPQLGESGLAKINLHPDDWASPSDREAYLDALNAEIYTGDPLSLSALKTLPLSTRPKALISVGMMLSQGLKNEFESHFNAPVLDIYSLNESGPVAVFDANINGHLLLQPELYVEILNTEGNPVPPGQRGEITLTGGFNFCLPLLRYRTGDFASLAYSPEGPLLKGLSGRSPVRFRTQAGDWVNNIDITHALKSLPLAQFGLHQEADGSLCLSLAPVSMHYSAASLDALSSVFGNQPITVKSIESEDKIMQYTSNLKEGTLQ